MFSSVIANDNMCHNERNVRVVFKYFRLSNAEDKINAATSEKLLLVTYNIHLPDKVPIEWTPNDIDRITLRILELLDPLVPKSFVPIAIVGDGNCLFRALSKGFFNTESFHVHIRLLTSIDMILNPQFYDSKHPGFTDLFNDHRLPIGIYSSMIDIVLTLGKAVCMYTILAASAALGICVRTYCPSTGPVGGILLGDPHSRLVQGHDVSSTKITNFSLM